MQRKFSPKKMRLDHPSIILSIILTKSFVSIDLTSIYLSLSPPP